VYYGPVTNEKNARLADLTPREWAAALPLAAAAVVMGVVPQIFLAPMEPAVDRLVQRMAQGQTLQVQRAVPPLPATPAVRLVSADPSSAGAALAAPTR
jgi:NADH:ubiquinone oxidoreductase subunit 4 (subunit M)